MFCSWMVLILARTVEASWMVPQRSTDYHKYCLNAVI
jgi:hypothetical protein